MDRAAAARGVEGELSPHRPAHRGRYELRHRTAVGEGSTRPRRGGLAIYAPELTGVDIFSEDLVLIVAKDHPLASTPEPLTFATLAEYEILLPFRGTPIRREIDEASRLKALSSSRSSSSTDCAPLPRSPSTATGRQSFPRRCCRDTCATNSSPVTSTRSPSAGCYWRRVVSASRRPGAGHPRAAH